MGTVGIYNLTASINTINDPIIRARGNTSGVGAPDSKIKLFQLFNNATSVFTINADGSINSSGSVNTNTGGVSLPSTSTSNGITYYDGSKITSATQLIYKPVPAGASVLYFTGSGYLNAIQIEGGTTGQTSAFREGSIAVSVNNNKIARGFPASAVGPEYLVMKVQNSGSGYFTMDPRSLNFNNASRTAKSVSAGSQDTFHNVLQIQDNTFYFWPTLYNYSTVGRGAALGIGVSAGTTLSASACKAALHVNVFSASVANIGAGGWSGTATGVQNRAVGILVSYGSGSNNAPFVNNFYVSSSGNLYTRGWALIDGQTSTVSPPGPGYAFRVNGTAYVQGTLTKGGGSFLITHPDPTKAEQGYKLRHCFVESPTRGDNLYRYQVVTTQDNLSTTITLPDYWQYLNENPQVWISPINCFGIGYGTVNQDLTEINITTNVAGTYNVLLIGTRKDKLMKDYFDANGVEFIDNQNLST